MYRISRHWRGAALLAAVVLGFGGGAHAARAALGEVEDVAVPKARGAQALLQLAVQLALAAAMLGEDVPDGPGMLADFP